MEQTKRDESGQAVDASWGARALAHPLGRLSGVVAVYAVVVGAIHQASDLPSRYTWSAPLETLLDCWKADWFPVVVLVVAALGLAARPGARWSEALHGLRAPFAPTTRRLAIVAVACAALDRLLAPGRPWVDSLAVAALVGGGALLWRRPRLGRAALDLGIVVVCFSLVSYGFTVTKALLFTARAPMDASMLRVEEVIFGALPHRAVASWAASHPGWVRLLDDVYFRLFDHMMVASVFLLAAGRITERWRLLAALAWCYMVGSVAYYAWPGVGPAFFDPEAYAFLGQQGGLHTTVIQKLLSHNTGAVAEGRAFRLESYAYIACMPSLHIAHELVMLWYARSSRLFFALSAVFSVLTVVSTVVLGWHYPIDALGGGLLAAVAIGLARFTVQDTARSPLPG